MLFLLVTACTSVEPKMSEKASLKYDIKNNESTLVINKDDLYFSITKREYYADIRYKRENFEYQTQEIRGTALTNKMWRLSLALDPKNPKDKNRYISVNASVKNRLPPFFQDKYLRSETSCMLNIGLHFRIYAKEYLRDHDEQIVFIEQLSLKMLDSNNTEPLAGCYSVTLGGNTKKIDNNFFRIEEYTSDKWEAEVAHYTKIDSLLEFHTAIMLVDTTYYDPKDKEDYRLFFHWRDTISPVSF